MASCRARAGVLALALVCSAWAQTAAALNCPDLNPRLLFTYPSDGEPAFPQDAVFWAVGTNLVVLTEAHLDETLRLEPQGAAPPHNWMFVPPEPLSPGRHSILFRFRSLDDEFFEDVGYADFEVTEGARVSADANAAPAVTLTGQRFSLPVPLFGSQRSAYEAELQRLHGEGDCSSYVQAQHGYCYDFEQGAAVDVWGRNGRGAPIQLWTGLEPGPDVLGVLMGERFLPPRCTSTSWYNDRFEGSIAAVPLLPTGLGTPVVLADDAIFTWEPPPQPETKRFARGHNCSLGLSPAPGASKATPLVLLVLLGAALVRRRFAPDLRAARRPWAPQPI